MHANKHIFRCVCLIFFLCAFSIHHSMFKAPAVKSLRSRAGVAAPLFVPEDFSCGARFAAAPPCEGPIVFRYDFGGGGYGDCLKGFVAVAQLACVLGCPFSADFSRHPFGVTLPFAASAAIPAELAGINDGDPRFVNIGDWATGPQRLAARDGLFAAMAPPATALRGTGAVVVANIPHHRELARALKVREGSLEALSRFIFSSFYSRVLDGEALGSYWPAAAQGAPAPFRVGFHVRMGDMHIAAARGGPTTGDNRNPDHGELAAALRLAAAQALLLSGGRPVLFFACADTVEARELLRSSLAPTPVILAPSEPMHIGFKNSFALAGAAQGTLSVAREHHTLSTADAVFIAATSGFSKTACAVAGAQSPTHVRCFIRVGADWAPLEPGGGVWD